MRKIFPSLFFALIILSFCAPLAYGQDEIYYSTYLKLNAEVESTLQITRQAGDSIDYVKAELYFFPKTDVRQEVLEISTEPEADPSDEAFVFQWDSPSENLLRYRVDSYVKVANKFERVFNKINFPLTDTIPPEVAEYTNPTEKIDSGNRDIIELANTIAEGEDDLYIIIHKMATWVKENVEYDLNTVTAEATQKASWVLDNKYGVCDEITALFMALCRSIGIPARFISGVSYTNDPQFEENWGPHGWAEVYLPGHGWVPFDVTYGELGWIDPSHIKLSESEDPDKPSGRLEWKGRNIDVKSGKINVDVEIKETGGRILDTVEINARVMKKEIGFGSYNLVQADIKNLRSYYVTTDISLSTPKEIDIEGKQNRQIILKPDETKRVFWILKADQNLDRKYIYTMPVQAYNQRNTSDREEFKVAYEEAVYSHEEIKELMERLELESEEKTYSQELRASCAAEKQKFYVYEENKIECNIENLGNTVIKGLNACIGNDCKKVDITIGQKKKVDFALKSQNPGTRDIVFTASNNEASATAYIPVVVMDVPKAEIQDIDYPPEADYGETLSLKFSVTKESSSDLINAVVLVESSRIKNEWEIERVTTTRNFQLDFPAKDLAEGENEFRITAAFEDENGREYDANEEFIITLSELSFSQKVSVKIKGIMYFFINLFS